MLQNIYNQRITIINKLKRVDSKTGLDVWYKHTVDDVAWYTDSARSASSSSVFIGTYITVLMPFNDKYMQYKKWKTGGNVDEYFTISNGDYIVLGDVEEDITASNVIAVMQKYEPDVCQVKHIQELHDRFNATVQLKIEGV